MHRPRVIHSRGIVLLSLFDIRIQNIQKGRLTWRPYDHRFRIDQRAVRPVLLVTVFFDTVNVVPASTTSLPCVTRSVAKNQFGVVDDAMSVNLSVA